MQYKYFYIEHKPGTVWKKENEAVYL